MTADTPGIDSDADTAGSDARATGPDASVPPIGQRHEAVELPVVPPAIPREEVESTGRVGAVAYPYRVYEATVTVERPLLAPRTDRRIVSVDRSRRLALRADSVPELESRTVGDALVLPAELSSEEATEKARNAVFKWTLRTSVLSDVPEVEFDRVMDTYKLFWLAECLDGDTIIDSVRGTERPLEE